MVRPVARALLLRDGAALLIQRERGGETYFVLPGGGIELDEAPLDACRREVREETGLTVSDFAGIVVVTGPCGPIHVFVADAPEGPLRLEGPEQARQSVEDRHTPVWIPIAGLDTLRLYPLEARAAVFTYLDRMGRDHHG